MKRLILLFLILTQAACTSVEKLESSPACQVWEDQPMIGPNALLVQGTKAEWKGSCAIMGLFMCNYLTGEMAPKTQAISLTGSGIFEGKTKVAQLEGDQVIFEKTVLDGLASSSPVVIDMEKRELKRVVKTNVIVEMESAQTLNFNKSCTKEQAAVGAITLWAPKNRRK